MAIKAISAESPDELDARAFELEAEASLLHARAARLRAAKCTTEVSYLDAKTLARPRGPLPWKRVRIACSSGALPATKQGRTWLVTKADADAFLASSSASARPANDTDVDDGLRARLGLKRKSA